LSSYCKNDYLPLECIFISEEKLPPGKGKKGFYFKTKPNSQEVFTLSLKKN